MWRTTVAKILHGWLTEDIVILNGVLIDAYFRCILHDMVMQPAVHLCLMQTAIFMGLDHALLIYICHGSSNWNAAFWLFNLLITFWLQTALHPLNWGNFDLLIMGILIDFNSIHCGWLGMQYSSMLLFERNSHFTNENNDCNGIHCGWRSMQYSSMLLFERNSHFINENNNCHGHFHIYKSTDKHGDDITLKKTG